MSKNTQSSLLNNGIYIDPSTLNISIGTQLTSRVLNVYSATADNHVLIAGTAPSVAMTNAMSGATLQAKFGLATASGQFASGSVAGDFVISCQNGSTLFAINSVEKARLNNNGTFSIGNTNSTYKLDVTGTGRFSDALSGTSATFSGNVKSVGTTIKNPSSDGSTPLISIRDTSDVYEIGYLNFNQSTDMMTLMNKQGYSLSGIMFGTNNTERMRITSGGTLCVGRTSAPSSAYRLAVQDAVFMAVSTNGNNMINFFNQSDGYVASIVVNASTVIYGVGSDYRLKEDYRDFSGLKKISAIKVYDFKYKKDGDRMEGVIAHELQEVIPYAVTGIKDEKNNDGTDKIQQVDYSKLVPILVKGMQEQQQIISNLESRILTQQQLINSLTQRLDKAGL